VKPQTVIGPFLMLVCLCAAGCNTTEREETPVQTQQKTQLAEQERLAAQTTQTYKAMDNAALIQKLAEQSARKREPFNSLAYRELVGRKDVDSKALVALVDEKKNADALLPLLLLRKLDEKTYLQIPVEVRSTVLTDALEQSKMFNTWGLPNFYLEDASKALLECGQIAYPALKRMLSDTRPAPIFGSKAYMIYLRYKFRLCDYALFFLERLQGNANFELPMSVSDRDTLIKGISK
jgi:hypothetical protein